MNASPIRSGASLRTFDQLDSGIRGWALEQGCEEWRFPMLISAEVLCRAEYPVAFPHLVMASAVAAEPDAPFVGANVRLAGWFLSPAVCYHAYAALAGAKVERGHFITARGSCFRHEVAAELTPGRRQIEFEMRELILVGAPHWIDERLETLKSGVELLAAGHGLHPVAWRPANDPFFLPRARGKAHIQRLLGTKIELCLPDGLAIASINRHGAFFGERFHIRTSGEACAHSACVAFGLDRWAAHQAKIL